MPKKTSRAARVSQSQRSVREIDKRKIEGARPLVATASALADVENEVPIIELPDSHFEVVPDMGKVAAAMPVTSGIPEVSRPVVANRARGPLSTRRFASTRQPAISREQEYSFIRSDLLAVLILTVLMVVALVVLTVVIGR